MCVLNIHYSIIILQYFVFHDTVSICIGFRTTGFLHSVLISPAAEQTTVRSGGVWCPAGGVSDGRGF